MGFIGVVLSIPLIGYVVSPALVRRVRDWAEAGSMDQLSPGIPEELTYVVSLQDGWLKTAEAKSVWAIRQPDNGIQVFSPLCTHLGCAYRWNTGGKKFICPCHNSIFDITGKVLSGPAPRSLDPLPVKIENGKVFVIYKEFVAGTSKRIEL